MFTDFTTLALAIGGLAVATETLTEIVKAVLKDYIELTDKHKFVVSLILGVVLALALHIGIFDTDNEVLFYFGSLLAGAIASRGANRAHEILDTIRNLKK